MIEKGDETTWNVMLDRFVNEQNAQEKKKLLAGLGKNLLLAYICSEMVKLKISTQYDYYINISLFHLYSAYVREPWIIKLFLNLAKNETIVRSQDYFSCLTYISRNKIGKLF